MLVLQFKLLGKDFQLINSGQNIKIDINSHHAFSLTEDNEPCIKLLEAYPCENKQQLLERERYWLEQYPDAVNKNPPILSEDERLKRSREIALRCYYKNQEQNITRNRQYKFEHKEEISEKKRQQRLDNPEASRLKDKQSNERRDKAKRNE